MPINLLDRIVASVLPQAGLKRIRARAALDVAQRAYDGAGKALAASSWRTGGASATSELAPALAALRNRSRDLIRNSGYLRHALDVWVANIIGTGITPNWNNKKNQALWTDWTKQCDADGLLDFYGLQALIARAMRESGECLVRFRNRRPEDGLTVPLQLQVLESDYLDSSRNGPLEGGYAVAGVQFNLIGQRVGYWLFDQHPGESLIFTKNLTSRLQSANDVLHLYDPIKRPGLIRGEPEFAVSIWRVRDLDQYRESLRVRRQVEACFAAFVTTSDENRRMGSALPAGAAGPGGARVEQLSPGMIEYLSPEESVEFSSPQPSSGDSGYFRDELREIAAGSGITYEQMTGDYSQVNFSSGRMGKMEFKRLMEQQQWLILIPRLCNAVALRWAQTAYLSGALRKIPALPEWTAPRLEMIDPLKETNAIVTQMDANLKSRQQAIREMGDNPETVSAEIKADTLKPPPKVLDQATKDPLADLDDDPPDSKDPKNPPDNNDK